MEWVRDVGYELKQTLVAAGARAPNAELEGKHAENRKAFMTGKLLKA